MTLTISEYKIIKSVRENLSADQLPWCSHWLFAKIQNKERLQDLPISSEVDLDKALQKLIKKKMVKVVNDDRYILNVEVTRYIK